MENNQDKINALESRQLELQQVMSESDRAALDYVKTLPGFAEAYPELAAAYAAAKGEMEQADAEVVNIKAEWEFHLGEWRDEGQEVIRNGETYEVLQGHTLQADWLPESTPALYKKKGGGEEWPEWVQPTGAHDVYMYGAKVSYDGKHWVSEIDNNSWVPGAYGWAEAK